MCLTPHTPMMISTTTTTTTLATPGKTTTPINSAHFGFASKAVEKAAPISWASMAAKAAASPGPETDSRPASPAVPATRTWSPKFKVVEVAKPKKEEVASIEVQEWDVDSQYYLDKGMGGVGRANGLKVRPDEAKRLAFSLAKRRSQRRSQK